MTLIVAKKIRGHLFVISDTALSDNNSSQLVQPLTDQCCKAIIIKPAIVLAFAGESETAEELFKKLSTIDTQSEIEDLVLKAHMNSFDGEDHRSEYLMGILEPVAELVQFKNGVKEYVQSAHLGSFQAFRHYQKHYNNLSEHPGNSGNKQSRKNSDTSKTKNIPRAEMLNMTLDFILMPETKIGTTEIPEYSNALNAFQSVIENGNDPTVSGFVFPIAMHKGEFKIMSYAKVFNNKSQFLQENLSSQLSFGDKESGSYVVSLVEIKSQSGEGVPYFHFSHGDCGVLFERKNCGLPRPIIFGNKCSLDIAIELMEKFELEKLPGFSIDNRLNDLGKKVEKQIENENYKEAIRWINNGLVWFEKNSTKWRLHESKYTIFAKLQDWKGAIQEVSQALKQADKNSLGRLWFKKGFAFSQIQTFRKSKFCLEKAISHSNKNRATFHALTICCLNLSIQNKSFEQLREANDNLYMSKHLGLNNNSFNDLFIKIQNHYNYLCRL